MRDDAEAGDRAHDREGEATPNETVIRARAPVRVSFAGGGSDVPPYCWNHGGGVVSTTIDRYARAALTPGGETIRLRAVDLDASGTFDLGADRLAYAGDGLDLLRAVVNQFDPPTGFQLTVTADLPPGGGMGGSSAVAVAAAAAMAEFTGREWSHEGVARLAYHAEREDLGEHGGYQDQYAAAYGGLNAITFHAGEERNVTVEAMDLPTAIRRGLRRRLLLYDTGATHDSDGIHEELDERYRDDRPTERERRDELKRVGQAIRNALRAGDLRRFGDRLHEGWQIKKRLSPRISTPVVDDVYETARANGAAGGKLLGAGGGGHVLLFARPGRTLDVIDALRDHPVERVPFDFDRAGCVTWRERSSRSDHGRTTEFTLPSDEEERRADETVGASTEGVE